MFKYFRWSILVLIIGVVLAYVRGESVDFGHGLSFVFSALIICVLEISLSFDNAVINAQKLQKMDEVWRQRFLTWGIAIAVFGMRFVFPVVIVAIFSGISCIDVIHLALSKPDEYAHHLEEANVGISAFGGAFLMMLFLEFMLDKTRYIHWIGFIERFLQKIGKIKFSAIIITALALLSVSLCVDNQEDMYLALVSGTFGILTHLIIHGVSAKLDVLAEKENAFAIKHAGLMSFLYLEVIDASFSLDGVLGAFALTKDVVIISIGLAVGAFFVRSMTIMLVERKTLEKFSYLTNGAYWAIGALAVIMMISVVGHVGEIISGTLGMFFIVGSLLSSLCRNRRLHRLKS